MDKTDLETITGAFDSAGVAYKLLWETWPVDEHGEQQNEALYHFERPKNTKYLNGFCYLFIRRGIIYGNGILDDYKKSFASTDDEYFKTLKKAVENIKYSSFTFGLNGVMCQQGTC